jgi:DinB family protein
LKSEMNAVLDSVFARLESAFLAVAEEMPDDKYSFRPSTGAFGDVRTFGEQVRHVAAMQWVIGAFLLGEKSPVDVGDGNDGPVSMTAKDDISKYAKDSFEYFRRAIASIHEENALEMIPHPFNPRANQVTRLFLALGYACHLCDHFGQMVVYQRMNGIVPPPSRQQKL